MALIEEIFGHEKNKENLLARIQELPSSLVFYGPPGIGKKKLVRGLLQRLNCSRDAKACGHCSACTRSLEKKNEMILEVSLEEKKSISVDQVRDVHDFIALKTMSPARFIIIDPADKLTVQASNALLKILEEPPERTHFFLIAETLSSLLPTIRSRSSIFRFQALSADQLQRVEGVKNSAVAWARGRADLALALSDPSGEEGLNAAQEMLITLLESVPLDWKKHYPAFFQDQNSHRFFIPVWEEMLSKKMRGEPFTKADSLPNENSALLAVFESLQSLRGELTKSFDKILCLENFYYQLQRTRKNPEAALWI